MATWRTILAGEVDPDSPVTADLMAALANNPTAITEAASGAPRIVTAALMAPVAGDAATILSIQSAEVEIDGLNSYPAVGLHNRFSAGQHLGFTCLVAGSVRCRFEHTGVVITRVLKNGTQLAEWTSSGTWIERTIDVTIAVGDFVIFQQRTQNAMASGRWRNIKVTTTQANFAVA